MKPAEFAATVYESIAVDNTSTYTDSALLAHTEAEKGPDTYWKELPSLFGEGHERIRFEADLMLTRRVFGRKSASHAGLPRTCKASPMEVTQ